VPALRKEQSRFVPDLLHEIGRWLRLRESKAGATTGTSQFFF
jgi:hypothetical protein